MVLKVVGAAAVVGALMNAAQVPAGAEPTPTPPPYCVGDDPGDLLNGVTCQEDINQTTGETPDPRPSEPPPGPGNPGGGGPGGGGPGGGGPGGGGPGGNDSQ